LYSTFLEILFGMGLSSKKGAKTNNDDIQISRQLPYAISITDMELRDASKWSEISLKRI